METDSFATFNLKFYDGGRNFTLWEVRILYKVTGVDNATL